MNYTRPFATAAATTESLGWQRCADILSPHRSDQSRRVIKPQHNRLLEAFPRDIGNRLFPSLQLELIPRGTIIYECGHPSRDVFFPIDLIVSLLCVAECGSTVEVAMVGNEGFAGIGALLGGEHETVRAQVWNTGYVYVLPAQRLGEGFDNNGELRMLLLRYTQSLFTEMAQTAYCNRQHSIFQQFCRWLLMALDRLPGSQLNVTQETIANTLGVRAASISEVACSLQKLGVIDCHRGKITVLDCPKLETLACECYGNVKNETEPLKGPLRPISLAN